MHTRKSVQGLLMAGAVFASGAVCAENSGWYAGLGVGQSTMDLSAGDVDALAAAEGLTTTTSVDDSDTAWKIFGGYRLMRNFGIEASYVDYGTITTDSTVTAPVAGTFDIDLDVTAWVIDAVGIVPVADGFELFGKAGIAMWDSEADFSAVAGGSAFSGNVDDDGSDFHFGIGASYTLMDNVAVRAEWERINEDDDLDVWTIGAQMSF